MARVPSLFVPLDANYLRDPAIRRAGPDAELLYVRGLAYAKSGDTDGVILECDLPVIAVGLRAVPRRVDALVKHGLWSPTLDGWTIRSWFKWNMTRDERVQEKEARRAGAVRTNHLRNHKDVRDPSCVHCNESLQRRSSDAPATELANAPASQREDRGRGRDRGKSEGESEAEGETEVYAPRGADAPTPQTLIAEWIDHCTDRPPSRVIGQLSREVKALLDEGIPYDVVRHSVAAWHRKALHPSSLASVVHEVRNPRTAGNGSTSRPTTDQRVIDAIDLARRLAEQESAGLHEIGA